MKDLFSHAEAEAKASAEPTTSLIRAFFRFHRENPHVYELFDRFTRQVIARGRTRYSSDAIFHRVRWETSIVTTGDVFKINDHHTAYYSRLWMRLNPEHKGLFRTRMVSGSIGDSA